MSDSLIEKCESGLFYDRVADYIKPAASVLDIGCGIHPQQFVVPDLLVCVEPHLEYVEILKKNLANANAIILPLEAKQALSGLPDNCVDSVFLIDVIEHMPKDIGVDVIKECERVARQQVVLFTPLGYMPQEVHAGESDGWNLGGGERQEHKSGWYPEDFPGWNILLCEHLHSIDHKGQPIDPPYGGFYAFKDINKTANYFNHIYSKDVIRNDTDALDVIEENFPDFVDKVVLRDIEKSHLRCGLLSCGKMRSFLVSQGAEKPVSELYELVAEDKKRLYMEEAREHNVRIGRFAETFREINDLSKANKLDNEALARTRSELVARESELVARESGLALRETNFSSSLVVRIMRHITKRI